MNKVIMMGRLTRDPDIRYSQEGTAIARFSLAVDRKFRKEDGSRDADFFNCTAFGKAAEFLYELDLLRVIWAVIGTV